MWDLLGSVTAFLLAYAVPGFVALSAADSPVYIQLLLSVPLGIALWGWQGWVFGFLNVRWVSYFYIVGMFVVFIKLFHKQKRVIKKEVLSYVKSQDYVTIAIVVTGVIVQSIMVWNVFVPFHGTLAQCCIDGNDTVWYASITKALLRSFPPEYPGLSGVTLHNYHYWSQLVVADLIRVFRLPQYPLQFRYDGILLSLFLGLTAVAFVTTFRMSTAIRRWIVFFLYFGGDALYIVPLIVKHIFGFPGSSLEDGVRFLGNPPRSYAIVLAFAWLALWNFWRNKYSTLRIILLSLLISCIIGFKIYVGMFLYIGLGAAAAWELLHRRYTDAILFAFSLFAAAFVYLPVNASAGGLYYVGFWRFDNFIIQPGLGLGRIELARKIFENDHKIAKVLVFEWFYVALYIATIFGTKLIGFIQTRKSLSTVPAVVHVFFLTAIVVNFVLGAFFLQSTGQSNSFNFLVNIFIFLSFYTAMGSAILTDVFRKNRIFKYIIIAIIAGLTIPRAIAVSHQLFYNTTHLTPFVAPQTQEILTALEKTPKNSVIAVKAENLPVDVIGPYMYLLSNRKQYLSAPSFLTLFSTDTFDREKNIDALTRIGSPSAQRRIVVHEGINYMILDSDVGRYISTASAYGLIPIRQTDLYTLYKVGDTMVR